MKKIIFVCTGNTCRSPMAMFLFNKIAKDKGISYIADSAGLAAFGDPINDNARKALAKIGINDIDYTSKRLSFYMVDEAEKIIVMTNQHKNALISAGVESEKIIILGDEITDPYGGNPEEYDECLNRISSGIDILLKEGLLK